MSLDSADTLAAWKKQLDDQVAPYLTIARTRRDGLQVVLYLNPDGKLGMPKVNIQTQGSRSET